MKILVVDSNPGSAENLSQSLQSLGWTRCGSAASSDDAVQWINQHAGCDILISDVFLQPADGLTLRETIQPHLPEMKTVFTSSHDVSAYRDRMAGCEFLASPVNPVILDSLLKKLTSASDAAPPVSASAVDLAVSPATETPPARPTAAPAARPTATPTATPSARPTATPSARPTATPTATPAAMPMAGPTARPAATPTARPTAAPAPKPAAKPAAVSPAIEIELPPDELVGKSFGNYLVEARIGKGPMGPIYRARQTNIDRRVRLYVLDQAAASNHETIEKFLSNASAKAKAANPVVITVYEAGEEDGIYFYSCEYMPSRSIGQLRESGGFLDEVTALAAIKAAAEALHLFGREKIPHDLPTENALLIGSGNRVRMANIAATVSSHETDHVAEMKRIGEIVLGCLPPNYVGKARDLAEILVDADNPPTSWAAFLQTFAAYQPRTVIADAFKLDAQDRAAIRAVEISKKRQKRGMIVSSLVSLALLAAGLGAIYYAFLRPKSSTVRSLDKMVLIPAGDFAYQDGEKVTLPAFYIDAHEVTIGQYAEFLDFLAKNPGEEDKLRHPNQPKGKSHVPVGWADMNELNPPMPGYYTRAKKWGRYQEAALDVNSPVFGVDWFDAFSYAKWKGRRLPTEQEWEKAARGTDGRKFSWGNNESAELANSGQDLDPNPKKGGEKDGFKRWNTVDAKKGDKSPFGMVGASGNVSEWTSSIVDSPEGGGKVPVIRGGNWKNPDTSVARRVVKLMDLQQDDALGFRTASDTAPEK